MDPELFTAPSPHTLLWFPCSCGTAAAHLNATHLPPTLPLLNLGEVAGSQRTSLGGQLEWSFAVYTALASTVRPEQSERCVALGAWWPPATSLLLRHSAVPSAQQLSSRGPRSSSCPCGDSLPRESPT